jgi:hypothetical protein
MASKSDPTQTAPHTVNYYKVLGLDNYASVNEVRKAYKGLVKTTHPDVVPEAERPSATEAFKTILLAYTVLNHPGKKQYYDEQLKSMLDAVESRLKTHKSKMGNSQEDSDDTQASVSNTPTTKKKNSKKNHESAHQTEHIAVPSRPSFGKKWHTLYVVENKPNVWHATWESTSKHRQMANEKGILFKCVNYYTQAVLQHVQVPFQVIPHGVHETHIKLSIDGNITLHLKIEACNDKAGAWFGTSDKKPRQAPEIQMDEEEDADSETPNPSTSTPSDAVNEKKTEETLLVLQVWEAVLGTEKQVQLAGQTEMGKVQVPAGVQHNQQLRITHQGQQHLLRIVVKIPTSLNQEERNCYELLQHLDDN